MPYLRYIFEEDWTKITVTIVDETFVQKHTDRRTDLYSSVLYPSNAMDCIGETSTQKTSRNFLSGIACKSMFLVQLFKDFHLLRISQVDKRDK